MTDLEGGAVNGAAPRVGITSVFGDPKNPRTWSGAPRAIAIGLEQLGFAVETIHPAIGRARKYCYAGRHMLAGYGRIRNWESVFRGPSPRTFRARDVARQLAERGLSNVIHTGTLDLPMPEIRGGVRRFLYCDHTWNLSLKHRPDAAALSPSARAHFERLERKSYAQMTHIFTFGQFVRRNLIDHYGVSAKRVTAVGSGMGPIPPLSAGRTYDGRTLLFVAKHLFSAKGGFLLLDAFRIARAARPDLRLVVVGDPKHSKLAGSQQGVEFHSYLSLSELTALYRGASLLAQPMLNDPWGQVYLEALISRTPVVGLNRNGLPEIVADGRYGFLVDHAEPELLAETILDALSDRQRLARMGARGQHHVMKEYSWENVARAIAGTIREQ